MAVDQFPVTFEEFIVGDTVACFDIPNQKASFINYPAMADSQRHMFEMLWCQAECSDDEECTAPIENRPPQEPDMETRVFSGLREFFMSKKGLSALMVCVLVALLITFGMYRYTLGIMKEEIGQRLMSIAATAAPEIDYEDLKPLRFARDMKRPEYKSIHKKLNEIRNTNANISYTYIMRPTYDEVSIWEFVVDADTTYKINNSSDTSPTGMQYDLLPFSPEMNSYGLEKPTYEKDFIYDQWGVSISAGAPIYNIDGIGIAVLGVDMDVSDVYEEVNNRFKPYIWFIVTFGLLLVARLFSLKKAS